jgi:hypothetical protein
MCRSGLIAAHVFDQWSNVQVQAGMGADRALSLDDQRTGRRDTGRGCDGAVSEEAQQRPGRALEAVPDPAAAALVYAAVDGPYY